MRKVFVFASVVIIHLLLQFAAWSYADSPRLNSATMRALFTILATPVVVIWGSITG